MKIRSHASLCLARGFTLLELLVVVAIIVILASLTVGGITVMQRNQAISKCKAQIAMIGSALEEYKMDFGRYPVANDSGGTNETGSNVLFKALYWDSDNNGQGVGSDANQRIYLVELDPTQKKQGWASATTAGTNNTILDPWGANYRYRSGTLADGSVNSNAKNPDFDLWSLGPDGKPGTAAGTDKEAADNITNW
jgi:general secretion pathway protein G